MRRKNISTGSPWEGKIGYSRAVRVGSTVHVSGTAGLDDSDNVVKGDAYAQAKRALERVREALMKAGAEMKDVVQTRIYLKNVDDWEKVGQAHGEFFKDIRPATTIAEVSRFLHPDILVEIEVKAKIGITEQIDEDARPVHFIHAVSETNITMVRDLFEQYATSLGNEFENINFEGELKNLPAPYKPPTGALVLATYEGEPAGCVAVKQVNDNTCELKRLYVPPQYRGNHIGKGLVNAAMEAARKLGYKMMILDTEMSMKNAMALFDEIGFKQEAQGHFEYDLKN
jgi:enamine deaminase RidA (YjgF/YER057c/UK114 family)/GNAT superfamily N-acetyltransferase